MAPVSVALVEDDSRTRERLVNVIGAEPTLRLAFACGTAAEALAWLEDNAADVLLVDLGLPDLPGLEVIRRTARRQPACSVMVITMFGDEANMLQAFEAGARGYLLKDGTEADLAAHVLSLHAGGSPMSPMIARQLLQRWQASAVPAIAVAAAPSPGTTAASHKAGPRSAAGAERAERAEGADSAEGAGVTAGTTALRADAADPLSRREREVLDLIARGFTYPEIAQQLGLSVTTVQTHVRNIYGKLGVHNKTEAVYEARLAGLLP